MMLQTLRAASRSQASPLAAWLLQARSVSGYSMPSPLKLAELMDVDAIKDKSSDQISNIWMAYHRDEKKHRIGGLMTAAEYNTLSKNAKESPMFVLPVFKPGGGYLTMAMQWQRPFFLFTTLQEFRKAGAAAAPHLTVTHYPELAETKNLVLMRGDLVTPNLVDAKEARTLMELTKAFYTVPRDYEWVHRFNHSPSTFDFDSLLKKLGYAGGPPLTPAAAAPSADSHSSR